MSDEEVIGGAEAPRYEYGNVIQDNGARGLLWVFVVFALLVMSELTWIAADTINLTHRIVAMESLCKPLKQ